MWHGETWESYVYRVLTTMKPYRFSSGNDGDESGKISIYGLKEGWYRIIEVASGIDEYGADGYPAVDIYIKNDTTNTNNVPFYIVNEKNNISISGFIWKDLFQEKSTTKDNVYNLGQEYGVDGITVRLKDTNGNTVTNKAGTLCETKTGEYGIYYEINGGEYIFEGIEKSKLSDYYVEFEYNGLIYQSVDIGAGQDIATNSKAIEGTNGQNRSELDQKFTNGIVNNGSNSAKVNGRSDISIGYKDTENSWTKEIDQNNISGCNIVARTEVSGWDAYSNLSLANLYGIYGNGVMYVNLGIYEKPQADLALGKDLVNVDIQVAGSGGIYEYEKRDFEKDTSYWDVGVKFKDKITETYTQPIFRPDVEYSSDNKDEELQVYLTYKIAVKNESSYLTSVNSIVDYFDSRYSLVSAGTGLSGSNITGQINATEQSYNSSYKKAIVDSNLVVGEGEIKYIYVQFKLERTAVYTMMNGNDELLYNRAEINSYTVFKDNQGNAVAAVDRDSVPGNMKPNDTSTFEDDTDSAPALKIVFKNREIHGTVFEDNATVSGEGNIRQGDGIYNNGEKGISGVKVELVNTNSGKVVTSSTTDNSGNYTLSGFVPGKYRIVYSWGDNTYRVQDYKGTIYDVNRNQNDVYWYKDQVSVRKTDAIDDYSERIKIDKQTAEITDRSIYEKIDEAYTSNYNGDIINSMTSSTPTAKFEIEYKIIEIEGEDGEIITEVEEITDYVVNNVDFGIIKRAEQKLEVEKRISSFKITLANGNPLVDATIDENGELQNSYNHTTYMQPDTVNGISTRGYVKTEMDNELIEGATLEVGYLITYVNKSEKDYMTENYYKYGNKVAVNDKDLVTLTPYGVVDYLDNNLSFDVNKNNSKWKLTTKNDIEDYYTDDNKNKNLGTNLLNTKTLLYSENKISAIIPGKTGTIELNVSKLLSTSNDLTFSSNEMDTVQITKPTNKIGVQHTGTYVKEFPKAESEEVIITPSTGENRAYAVFVIVGIVSLVILGVGIYLIKIKILDN